MLFYKRHPAHKTMFREKYHKLWNKKKKHPLECLENILNVRAVRVKDRIKKTVFENTMGEDIGYN